VSSFGPTGVGRIISIKAHSNVTQLLHWLLGIGQIARSRRSRRDAAFAPHLSLGTYVPPSATIQPSQDNVVGQDFRIRKVVDITGNPVQQRVSGPIKVGANTSQQSFDAKLAAVSSLDVDNPIDVKHNEVSCGKLNFGGLTSKTRSAGCGIEGARWARSSSKAQQ
jgi:hypothetical protein